MRREEPLTVGIGVICEGGDCVVLASDMRVTYGRTPIDPHDKAGKQYSFPPFNLAVAIAGSPSSTHAILSELAGQLRNLLSAYVKAKNATPNAKIYFEHIRNAIEGARKRELRRLQDCAINGELGVNLSDWIAGKLSSGIPFNEYAHRRGLDVLRRVKDEMQYQAAIIIAGFLRDDPVFCRGIGAQPLEEAASPAIHVIGGQGAVDALQHLITREQNIEMGIARTLLHIYEALKIARKDKYVGKASYYTVMRPWSVGIPNGRLRFASEHPTLQQWSREYATRDTEPLESRFANDLVNRGMVADRSKPSQQLGPRTLMSEL